MTEYRCYCIDCRRRWLDVGRFIRCPFCGSRWVVDRND